MTNTKKSISSYEEVTDYLTKKMTEIPQRVKTLEIKDRKQIAIAITQILVDILYMAKFNSALQRDLLHADWEYFFEDARNSPIERIRKHGYHFEKSRQMISHFDDAITEMIGLALFIRNTSVADEKTEKGKIYRDPRTVEYLLEELELKEDINFDAEPPLKMPTNFARYLASLIQPVLIEVGKMLDEINKNIESEAFQKHTEYEPYELEFVEKIALTLKEYRAKEREHLTLIKNKKGNIIGRSIT